VEPRTEKKSRFSITKLEMRIAPTPPIVRIPSTDISDPSVNGAEHACPGLHHAVNNPNQAIQLYRHACECSCGCGC
jgi:hypothetical protein